MITCDNSGRPNGGRSVTGVADFEQALRLQSMRRGRDRLRKLQQAVAAYTDLQIVERAFRCLKDVLAMRPIYHQTARRVRAHLFVAHLALLLGVALEKALRRAGLEMALVLQPCGFQPA